ncbi:hypothetical protein F903_01712 [Acinetobacter sp. NIPH 298]|nr:hypothetical protein F903_01712 [Acinetobacter sp. NIPH 298]
MTKTEFFLGLLASAILALGYAATWFMENSYAIL